MTQKKVNRIANKGVLSSLGFLSTVGSNPTSHTLGQRLWDLVTRSLFLFIVMITDIPSHSGFNWCMEKLA
jgi:hypothetical protein